MKSEVPLAAERKIDNIELYAIVSGEVQGVGFRATTRHIATQLGLRGSVRNLSDGRVEIIAQGSREQVDTLIQRLQDYPGLGSVESITSEYRRPAALFDAFQITR